MKPPEGIRSKLVSDWLKAAFGDLSVARELAPKGPRFFVFVLFHAQQSVEKCLKAFLVWHQVTFKYTHDIASLGDLCVSRDPALGALAKEADTLTKYAVSTRYPGEEFDPSAIETKHGVKTMERVFNEILKRLPKEVHPVDMKGRSKNRRRRKGRH